MYEAEMIALDVISDRATNSVDVGAYSGLYIQKLLSVSSHVFAYEPLPWYAKTLRYMFADSPVTIRQVALGSVNGTATLHTPRYTNSQESVDRFVDEWSSLTQTYQGVHRQYPDKFPEVRRMPVETVTLDSENIPNLGFMKIDVEGAEPEVLQ